MKHFFFSALRTLICLMVGLCFPVLLYGQYDGTIPRVTTSTPNAAALFKTEGRPAGSFTGTTPISIPLYTLSSGSLQVPVGLSYSNGGIKVEEISSWVGLGWNLSTGGRITRSMNGVADDEPGKGMLSTSPKPSVFPGSGGLVSNAAFVLNGAMDTEPDNFYFDCNGMSGKFFLDENGNVKLVSQQELKIEFIRTTGTIQGWIITDTKGNKYYFGMDKAQSVNARELTSISYDGSGSTPGPMPAYVSSWHLMEIRDMNEQNIIKFYYTQYSTTFRTLAGASLAIGNISGGDCTPGESVGLEMVTINNTEEFYLNKIEGGMDSLIFHSSANRKDFSGGRRLDSLTFYARNNELVKRHHFNYGYFTATGAPADSSNDTYYKRLKLGKLSEFGLAANDSLVHRFDYIESVNLPPRSDMGIDYWGYYNGANNQSLTPKGVYRDGYTTYFVTAGGERRSNPAYSIANTLKKVTYPTGGSREFEYEGNQALLDYYDTQINPDASQYTSKDFTETNFSPFASIFLPVASRNFTINGDDGLSVFRWTMTAADCSSNDFTVKLIKIGNGVPDYEVTSWHSSYGDQYTLNNGNYKIEVYQGVGCSTLSSISGFWAERVMPATVTRYNGGYLALNNNVGGIRVREIKDYDPASGVTNRISYQYNLFANPGLTSGMLVSPVRVLHEGGCSTRNCNYLRLNSSSTYPLIADGGSYVVYPEVKTIEDGNGYNERTFSFAYDVEPLSIDIHDFPIVPVRDNSWKRGRMSWERVYNSSGLKVSERYSEGHELGNYSSLDLMVASQMGHRVVGYFSSSGCPSPGMSGQVCAACMKSYHVYSQFNATRKQMERSYNADGSYIEQLTEYDYYTNLGRTLLKEQRVYLSDGKVKTTNYKYAFNGVGDFVFGLSSAEQSMKTLLLGKNYMEPLEVTTKVGPSAGTGTLVQGAKFAFANFNVNAVHLANVKLYSSASDFKETVLSNYDAKGNLAEKYEVGGTPETYLWGYKGAYPVAKIIGANLSAVSPYFVQQNLNNPGSEAAFGSYLNSIRAALSGTSAQVSTFTYKPLVGMSSQTDAKGMTTSYGYDRFGRLENIKDQNGDIVKNYRYNYADGTAAAPVAPVYWSAEVTVSRTKNNCTSGTGSLVAYTIPAKKYSSMVDQATANAMAQADADAGAQGNANQNGNCGTPGNGTVSLSYSLPGTVQFKLRITNVATSTYTDHTLSSIGTLNNITPGTVNLALSEVTASSTVYNFSLNGDAKSGNTTSYNNFAFTANANLTITTAPAGGPYYNTAQTITKTKNNCPSGTGTAVGYPVAANTYSSAVSVADANLLALAGGDAAAQANANAQGGCSIDGIINYYSQVTTVTKSRNNCPNGVGGVPQTSSYPLGAFSSLISVADADQKLHNDAQASVNITGSCAITTGTFTLNYSTNSTWMFTIHVKDAQGNTLSRPSIQGSRVLTDIPGGGTGSITITPYPADFPLPAGMTFSYSVNGSPVQTSTPAHFAGLTLSGTVNVTITQTSFPNKSMTLIKTKNNCASGENGSQVSYVVQAATYWAATQTAADQLAQADLNANAQNHANTNGTCEVATSPISVYYTPGAKLLIEVTHLARNTTVSYTSTGTNSGTIMYVPIGLSKVKITNLQSGKTYRMVLSGQVQTGSTVEYASVNFPGYLFNLNIQEIFSNAALNVSKTKTNCYGANETGSAVTYTVPAGKYTSLVSQTEADQLAQDDADTNAQSYANTNGTCITVYYSIAQNISKTRNDCPSGQIGSAVSYYVYGGKYTSTISQADADQKALTNEDANAQANANTNGGCTLPPTYYNAYLSVTKTRNNCTTAGYTGSSVTYTVPASRYSSLISQADANQKAQADADANAQNYANTNGTCNPPVTYYSAGAYRYITKNNCPPGDNGSNVTYSVLYGKYTSLISQADADQQAQADLNANAQNYANANGTCTTPTFTLNYEVPDDLYFKVKLHNPTLGLTFYHTIVGTGSLTNIRGGTGWTVDVYPDEPNNINYYYSMWDGQATAHGNTASFGSGYYLYGNVSLTIRPE